MTPHTVRRACPLSGLAAGGSRKAGAAAKSGRRAAGTSPTTVYRPCRRSALHGTPCLSPTPCCRFRHRPPAPSGIRCAFRRVRRGYRGRRALRLFDAPRREPRLQLPDCTDGIWRGCRARAASQPYGYRVYGPVRPTSAVTASAQAADRPVCASSPGSAALEQRPCTAAATAWAVH